MVIVDTSAWVEFFRGREPLASVVDELLATNEAAVCGPVITELRRGLAAAERKRVLPLLDGCHWLPQPDDLWTTAGELGFGLRRKGVTAKTLDLLIAVHALAHNAELATADAEFVAMARAGFGIRLRK
jgi:tRNA(fMet)-specific endonuclease VapC